MQNPKQIKKRKINKLPDEIIILDEEPVKVVETATSTVQTEDLGKKFEMGICLLYGIPYDGKYKYSMEEAEKIRDRIAPLLNIFSHQIRHTAKNGSQYDFTGLHDETIRLSAKTTKKDGKVAPQVIGQPSRKKFCDVFGIDTGVTDVSGNMSEVKQFIENNVASMLEKYFDTTFDCPILYYNQHKNKLQFIKLMKKVDWPLQAINFTKTGSAWNESSSIKIGKVTIGEFQVHNHRDCIKFRWSFEKLIEQFNDCFEITNL